MKAEELMIGDWVLKDMNYLEDDPMYTRPDYQPYQIENGEDIDLSCESNCLGDADVYQPIPLTDEILEANGWVYFHPQGIKGTMMLAIGGHAVLCWDSETKELILTGGSILKVRYVHELHHVLRLCGIEKEIIVKQ